MFDLEKSLAAWRHYLKHNRTFSKDDLDELEQHLRDEITARVASGEQTALAFNKAMQEMGDYGQAETEYDKVFWGKLKRQQRLSSEFSWRLDMLRNYFKVALRSLRKQKGYAFINIFGLAIGLACFIMILLFVQHEFSYNRFYEDADRIHRVVQRIPGATYKGSEYVAMMPAPLAGALMRDFPEIEQATNIADHQALLGYEDNHFLETGLWADENFLDVFSISLLQGNQNTALQAPNSIVLSRALADKIFNAIEPIGKSIVLEDTVMFKVTGIMENPPLNSTFHYGYLTSFLSHEDYQIDLNNNRWNSNYLYTFFRTAQGTDLDQLQTKINGMVDTYIYAGMEAGADEAREAFLIQGLRDVHLRSHFNHDIGAMTGTENKGNLINLYLFLTIGIIILVLACVNYVNLAIARSLRRAREVGLRKSVGAGRKQVVGQFLGESTLIALLALLMALLLVHAFLPLFSELVDRPLRLNYLENPFVLPGLLLLLMVVGFLSGSYPALFMASLQPKEVLKGTFNSQPSQARLQKALVVVQYTASIALIICGTVIYEQLQYVQNRDIGYDKAHVVTIRLQNNNIALDDSYTMLRDQWLSNPNISAVTASSYLPTSIDGQRRISGWAGSMEDDRLPIYVNNVDEDYLDVFGLELAAGRTFSSDIVSDIEHGKLINESAARAMGWTPEEAIGQRFTYDRAPGKEVIGVLKDFHLHSMHMEIQPVMFNLSDRYTRYISVKVLPNDLPGTIAYLDKTVQAVTSYPFEYQFLDDQFDQLYRADQQFGKIFAFFTVLALLIATLGLFGLAAYSAQQRTKEIGVRKVLGASSAEIVVMLTKDFTRLVVIGAVLAAPIAYLAMYRYLDGFAYHTKLGPGVFLLAGVIALAIAVLTVSYQAVRAAVANPGQTLRFE